MSWTRIGALLPAVLACCGRVSAEGPTDGGSLELPTVTEVEPEPGLVSPTAAFVVHFSTAMDEGVLLASSGRSETVALSGETDVEAAAAALEHSALSAHERSLLVSTAIAIGSDRRSVTLAPDVPLRPGAYFLLVSPRLRDEQGRKIGGVTQRFAFEVPDPAPTGGLAPRATLVSPRAGGDAPTNLGVVRATAPAGRVALLGPDGHVMSAVDARGEVVLPVAGPLVPGGRYTLAVDDVVQPDQSFTAASCARTAPPALQGGSATLIARDMAVEVRFRLDWPAQAEIRVGKSIEGAPCAGECFAVAQQVLCAPPACGPQVFACEVDVRIAGLSPATNYGVQLVLRDDEGHAANSAIQRFATVAPLPRMLISEVKSSPTAGEYVELINLGPGAADVATLALVAGDGTSRPLLGERPPLPVVLQPGTRALAVGASFDPALYPSMPQDTPVLRAEAQRLLGRGLADRFPPPFRLAVTGDLLVEVDRFSADYVPVCALDESLQRDETEPPGTDGNWHCGRAGGTPGMPP